jgi:hypothetical protein
MLSYLTRGEVIEVAGFIRGRCSNQAEIEQAFGRIPRNLSSPIATILL